jgi:hypothetical protein
MEFEWAVTTPLPSRNFILMPFLLSQLWTVMLNSKGLLAVYLEGDPP